MSKLILVKHSLPEVMSDVPAKQWHLSAEGRLRCSVLAEKIAAYQPEVIVSSVEPKAIETATIISSLLDVSFETSEGLHEHEREQVGFLRKEAFEVFVAAFFAHPTKLVFGQETAQHALDRFTRAIEAVLSSHAGETVVVVAHGTVISLFVARYAQVSPFSWWQKLGLPSFVVLDLPVYQLITTVESVVSSC